MATLKDFYNKIKKDPVFAAGYNKLTSTDDVISKVISDGFILTPEDIDSLTSADPDILSSISGGVGSTTLILDNENCALNTVTFTYKK